MITLNVDLTTKVRPSVQEVTEAEALLEQYEVHIHPIVLDFMRLYDVYGFWMGSIRQIIADAERLTRPNNKYRISEGLREWIWECRDCPKDMTFRTRDDDVVYGAVGVSHSNESGYYLIFNGCFPQLQAMGFSVVDVDELDMRLYDYWMENWGCL